jgi:hypothetical protein
VFPFKEQLPNVPSFHIMEWRINNKREQIIQIDKSLSKNWKNLISSIDNVWKDIGTENGNKKENSYK